MLSNKLIFSFFLILLIFGPGSKVMDVFPSWYNINCGIVIIASLFLILKFIWKKYFRDDKRTIRRIASHSKKIERKIEQFKRRIEVANENYLKLDGELKLNKIDNKIKKAIHDNLIHYQEQRAIYVSAISLYKEKLKKLEQGQAHFEILKFTSELNQNEPKSLKEKILFFFKKEEFWLDIFVSKVDRNISKKIPSSLEGVIKRMNHKDREATLIALRRKIEEIERRG